MQPERAISNMSCMPWIIGWLLINSKLFCLCTLKYLTRRQNHYQFYGAPVFLIALSRAVNDLPGASNQSTGSMAWREAMEHQFFSLHHHSQNMLCLFLHGAGSWTTRDVHCTILTRISQQRVELCLCAARRLIWEINHYWCHFGSVQERG